MSPQRPPRRSTKHRARHARPFPPLRNPGLRQNLRPDLKPSPRPLVLRRISKQQSRRWTNTSNNSKRQPSLRTRKRNGRPREIQPQLKTTERTRRQTKTTTRNPKNRKGKTNMTDQTQAFNNEMATLAEDARNLMAATAD